MTAEPLLEVACGELLQNSHNTDFMNKILFDTSPKFFFCNIIMYIIYNLILVQIFSFAMYINFAFGTK